jgi:hypothetical protein
MDNAFIIWIIISIVAALGLDMWIYIVSRREWETRGVMLTDELWQQASDRLGLNRIAATWQERRSAKTKPAPVEGSAQQKEAQPVQQDLQAQSIAASVKTVGKVKHVQFSMDMPLDSAVEISISATPEAGVKVEKRRIR